MKNIRKRNKSVCNVFFFRLVVHFVLKMVAAISRAKFSDFRFSAFYFRPSMQTKTQIFNCNMFQAQNSKGNEWKPSLKRQTPVYFFKLQIIIPKERKKKTSKKKKTIQIVSNELESKNAE